MVYINTKYSNVEAGKLWQWKKKLYCTGNYKQKTDLFFRPKNHAPCEGNEHDAEGCNVTVCICSKYYFLIYFLLFLVSFNKCKCLKNIKDFNLFQHYAASENYEYIWIDHIFQLFRSNLYCVLPWNE
jgi:hypothetical protein